MPTPKDLENATKAMQTAWAYAVKCAHEVEEARRILDQIPARDTDDVFVQKVKRLSQARDNWINSVKLSQKVIDDYYKSQLE